MNIIKKEKITLNFLKLSAVYLVPFILLGCQSGWYPEVDFGSSVNKVILDQVANKNSPEIIDKESMGMDGPTAKLSIDNYQRSFEQSSGAPGYGSSSSGAFINPMGSSNASSLPSITGR